MRFSVQLIMGPGARLKKEGGDKIPEGTGSVFKQGPRGGDGETVNYTWRLYVVLEELIGELEVRFPSVHPMEKLVNTSFNSNWRS